MLNLKSKSKLWLQFMHKFSLCKLHCIRQVKVNFFFLDTFLYCWLFVSLSSCFCLVCLKWKSINNNTLCWLCWLTAPPPYSRYSRYSPPFRSFDSRAQRQISCPSGKMNISVNCHRCNGPVMSSKCSSEVSDELMPLLDYLIIDIWSQSLDYGLEYWLSK